MIRIYAEILAMDDKILERVRQLVVSPNDIDPEAKLGNLRLILTQLDNVGNRIAYWNQRTHKLLEDQLPQ